MQAVAVKSIFDLIEPVPGKVPLRLVKEHTQAITTIDYTQIERDLDAMEAKFKSTLRDVLTESRDAVLAMVKRKGTLPRDFTLPHAKDIQNVIGDALQKAMDRGGADAGKEIGWAKKDIKQHAVREYAKTPTFSPKAALKWLREKIFWVADVLTTGLEEDIRSAILNGLKTGKPNSEIITDIAQKYIPYLGDPAAVKDGELPTAARLETVVRTNINDAYNQGRIATFIRPDMMPFLDGVQYSSILDSRTTPLCRFLHDKIFKPDEIQATGLVPPNHFNERALVVAVPVGVISKPPDYKVDPKVYITPAEIEYARSLADAKFLEQCGDVHEHAEEEGVWRTVRGRHVFIREGETPTQAVKRSIAERSARSTIHHVPATKERQAQAAKYEETVARLIGGKNLDDHEPFDVIKGRHAVEVKCIVGGKNPKLTMHSDSLMRKANFLRDERMMGHTVAIDTRGSKPVYYYSKGVGSFRLSNMQQVAAAELKVLIGVGKYAEFDPYEHPRQPVGNERGGEFAPKSSLPIVPELQAAEDTRRAEFESKVRQMAKAEGVDPDKVVVDWDKQPEFDLNGTKYRTAGEAYIHTDKHITVYQRVMAPYSDADLAGLMAHEAEHVKFQTVLEKYSEERQALVKDERKAILNGREVDIMKSDGSLRLGYEKDYPVYSKLQPIDELQYEKLEKDDGVTQYSRDWWAAYKGGKASRHQAVHETMAEIARGESKHLISSEMVVSLLWRRYFNEVARAYKNIQKGKS